MKPAPFDYHAPTTLDGVVTLLDELDDAKILAGGQSLAPMLNMRIAYFDHLVDLRLVDELRGVERRSDALWIAAGTTQASIERDATVASSVPLLAQATPFIGHAQIRNRGTVGGSLAHADPAAEYPAVALALDAVFEAMSPDGRREIAAADFFHGHWTTALRSDEVLTGVRFPIWDGRCGFGVDEFARRHGDFAIAGACVALAVDGRDHVTRCAIGLFGLGRTPERATRAEEMAAGAAVADIDVAELGRAAVADLTAIPSDLNGSSDYRSGVAATIVGRAWGRAVRGVDHG